MFIPGIVLLIIITEGLLMMYKICSRVSDYRRYYYKGLKLKIKHQENIYDRVFRDYCREIFQGNQDRYVKTGSKFKRLKNSDIMLQVLKMDTIIWTSTLSKVDIGSIPTLIIDHCSPLLAALLNDIRVKTLNVVVFGSRKHKEQVLRTTNILNNKMTHKLSKTNVFYQHDYFVNQETLDICLNLTTFIRMEKTIDFSLAWGQTKRLLIWTHNYPPIIVERLRQRYGTGNLLTPPVGRIFFGRKVERNLCKCLAEREIGSPKAFQEYDIGWKYPV